MQSLPKHKRGKKLKSLKVKSRAIYVKALCTAGTEIGPSVMIAAVEGLVRAYDKTTH